ncbi:beta-N-acetylhexosaminidase [Caldalkalibacillus mannanilyticus]|uniref:beta-N-acetylhexosaminidase n=1 Tax=Caldalkalibacillus mannanilyticus TaxID=1418 RepID=UPI000B03F6AF|nr:beta-N-acetylhexosaminidase [Caldalkalibacillus mannanilyticus]
MEELSLRQKIGQMLICGFEGTSPSQEIIQFITENYIGGVIYFSRNIERTEQIHSLSRQLQQTARENKMPPLFISIDQEGGVVSRIIDNITLMPGNMALGATGDRRGVYEAAKITGQELRCLGINLNFAPCLDLFNNPLNPVIGVRAYGEDPKLVGEMGCAAVKGYQESGVAATIKHFPGHGDTQIDSHLDLPTIAHDVQHLLEVELLPFRQVIQQGVDAVMTAHIVFPALEPELPATLSPQAIGRLLRNELQYDGVIITDCLEMKAIASYYGSDEAAIRAVEAGVDLLLYSHRADRQKGAIEALVQAVQNGRIAEERIDQSVRRIFALKERRSMGQITPAWAECEALLQTREALVIAQRLSEQSITLVKGKGSLPLTRNQETLVIWVQQEVTTEVDEMVHPQERLAQVLASLQAKVRERIVSLSPSEEGIQTILAECESYEQIILTSFNAGDYPEQIQLIKELSTRKGDSLIVVALRNPTDLLHFPQVQTYLTTYESRPLALHSLAKVLVGEAEARGTLPFTLPL